MSEMIPGTLIDRVKAQVEDEKNAVTEYDHLAVIANNLGYKTAAETFRDIASDEARHRALLEQMLKRLEFDSRWAGRTMHVGEHRPVPQTYDDWANLGLDIVDKDEKLRQEVFDHLSNIYLHNVEEDNSKRWIVTKAGELGVT